MAVLKLLTVLTLALTGIQVFAFKPDHVYAGNDLQSLFAWPQATPSELTDSPRGVFDRWTQNLKKQLQTAAVMGGYALGALDAGTAFDWIPITLGDAPIDGTPITMSTPCYDQATLQVNYTQPPTFTLTTLYAILPPSHHIILTYHDSRRTANCAEDIYLVATPSGILFHKVTTDGTVQFAWDAALSEGERTWLSTNGFRIMRLAGDTDSMLTSLLSTLELFLPAELTKGVWPKIQAYNMDFLRKKAFYDLEPRNITDVIPNSDDVKDGDFFGVLRPDGLDPTLAWAMGAHTGHTTIALRFNGVLYICESTTDSAYWPTNGIQKTPYKQWIAQAKAASYQVVHLPLNAEARANFNTTAATTWFLEHAEGLPYGFANILTGWIDTNEANYPGNLNAKVHEILVGIVDSIAPGVADLIWNRALNQRLGTTNLSTIEIYNTAASRNMNFSDVFNIPEEDSWKYMSDFENKEEVVSSMVCDVLVCETWKAGGLFGALTDDIQCTEFTNWDVYSLNIFDTTTPRPAACVEADPSLPFCQILGDWRMSLPGYNTRKPIAKMAQHCPRGSPPNFDKPVGC